jgi:hypothetical protein
MSLHLHSGKTTVPRIKHLDKSKYIQTLESSLKTLDIKWSSTETKEEVDVVVEIITNTIATSASRSKLPYKFLSKKKIDFWCEELSMLKDSKQKAYNARDVSEANGNLYRGLKSQYQEKTKRKYMTEDMNKNPYKCLKNLAADQNNNQFPDELESNNSRITNKLDLMKEPSKSFFPDPKPINKKQQEYIDEYLTYLSNDKGPEPPPITNFELKNAVFSLKKNSAPG